LVTGWKIETSIVNLVIKPEKRLIEVWRRTLRLTAERQRGKHLLHKLQNNTHTHIQSSLAFLYPGRESRGDTYNQQNLTTCEGLLALSFMLRSCSRAWILFE